MIIDMEFDCPAPIPSSTPLFGQAEGVDAARRRRDGAEGYFWVILCDFCVAVLPSGVLLRYLTWSMNTRNLGNTWRPLG